jgi:hypothetical protein
MNINNRIKNKTMFVNGYKFNLVWCEHSNKYKIIHNNVQFLSSYTYRTLSKIKKDLQHITNNKQTYILNK